MSGMNRILVSTTALAVAVLFGCANTSAPAQSLSPPSIAPVNLTPIPEAQASAVVYVDGQAPNASDSNPGTELQPYLTISKAAGTAQANNRNGTGTTIWINPGVYREEIDLLPIKGQTSAPIIFQAAQFGAVTVSGSDVWTGWVRDSGQIYKHPWPYRWNLAPYPDGWQGNVTLQPIVRRREMIFVDGLLLTQVLGQSELADNTFYVSEGQGSVYVQVPAGQDLSASVVEVAIRPQSLIAHNQTNLVLRGIQFQHGNAPVQDGAVQIVDSTAVLIEDCDFSQNNWIGLSLSGSNGLTIRRSTANQNGATGIDGYKLKNVLLENTDTSYNNWRGALGRFYGWSVAGAKFGAMHGAVIRGHRSVRNQARGLWIDYDNTNISIEAGWWAWNWNDGVFLEASQGPILLKDSVIWANQNGGSGVLGANSQFVALQNNTICSNQNAQISISGDLDRQVTDFETGVTSDLRIANWTLDGNLIGSADASQMLFTTPNWSSFLSTFSSANNTWSKPGDPHAFSIGGSALTFPDWQKRTADYLSVYVGF